jgi:CRP/FNR family cyclic AMP-dependent transcriptional regulator
MQVDGNDIRKELIEALSQSKLLRYLGQNSQESKGLRTMLQECEVVTFNPGSPIMREGEESDRMYFLASGRIEVSKNGRAVCTMGRIGDVVGEAGVITGELRSATVTAATHVECLATKSVFDGPLSERENILFSHLMEKAVTRVLMGRLKNTNEDLAETKEKLDQSEKKVKQLTRKNASIEKHLQTLEQQASEGYRGTRQETDDPRKSSR